jgi:GNAT superfamily N-acetyltransferase
MIRAATSADIPALLALGRAMHAESWYGYIEFDEQKIFNVLTQLIDGAGFAEVYEAGGEVHGGMLGMVSEMWFCTALIATDLGLFMQPGKRGGIAATRLVNRFVEWAGSKGAVEVSLGISTGIAIKETGKLYETLGLTHVGGIYKARL